LSKLTGKLNTTRLIKKKETEKCQYSWKIQITKIRRCWKEQTGEDKPFHFIAYQSTNNGTYAATNQ
jgi:hypothetical protein